VSSQAEDTSSINQPSIRSQNVPLSNTDQPSSLPSQLIPSIPEVAGEVLDGQTFEQFPPDVGVVQIVSDPIHTHLTKQDDGVQIVSTADVVSTADATSAPPKAPPRKPRNKDLAPENANPSTQSGSFKQLQNTLESSEGMILCWRTTGIV